MDLGESELLGVGRNSDPEKVTTLQEMLKDNGLDLAVDGKFGPETRRAVEEYQRQNGLKIDGIVGPETMGSLNGGGAEDNSAVDPNSDVADPNSTVDPSNPAVPGELGQLNLADPNLSPAEQFEHYKNIIEANGGELNADGATVLGMRGVGTDGARHNSAENTGGYNDSFVVLNRDANGNPTVEVFRGATHANQFSSSQSYGTDRNGNGYNGVAQLMPGTYDVSYNSGNYKNSGASWHVKTTDGSGYVPAARDLDRNGIISSSEMATAVNNGITATAILFHNGRNASPSSIGCQTIIPSEHSAFTNAVGRDFSYTLVDANNGWIPG